MWCSKDEIILLKKIIRIRENLQMPEKLIRGILNPSSYNEEMIEKELQGKNLEETTKEEQKLLAYDLSLFSDESFRFYIFQFMQQIVGRSNPYSTDAFIQSFFKSESLDESSKRYRQFLKEEVEVIIGFLQFAFKNEDFEGWPDEIAEAIEFWQNHPALEH